MAKTNHIDSTRPDPLSMNELTNSLLNIRILIGLGFRNSKYRNSRNKTEVLVLLKKRNKYIAFVIFKLIISHCNA